MKILKHAEAGEAVPGQCRAVVLNKTTFYEWRARFG
jgi:hypothetical protein